jgi:hypothetical protein
MTHIEVYYHCNRVWILKPQPKASLTRWRLYIQSYRANCFICRDCHCGGLRAPVPITCLFPLSSPPRAPVNLQPCTNSPTSSQASQPPTRRHPPVPHALAPFPRTDFTHRLSLTCTSSEEATIDPNPPAPAQRVEPPPTPIVDQILLHHTSP